MKNNLKSFDELQKKNAAALPMCVAHVNLPDGTQRENKKWQMDLAFCESNLRVKRGQAAKVMRWWESQGKGTYDGTGYRSGKGHFTWNKGVNSFEYCMELIVAHLDGGAAQQ